MNSEMQLQEEQRQFKEYQKRVMQEREERESIIKGLKGKERRFYKAIRKAQAIPDIDHYCIMAWQMKLLSKLYHNNLLNGSYDCFCYGFYMGMQYANNKQGKKGKDNE